MRHEVAVDVDALKRDYVENGYSIERLIGLHGASSYGVVRRRLIAAGVPLRKRGERARKG
jgi:hypothetical protein